MIILACLSLLLSVRKNKAIVLSRPSVSELKDKDNTLSTVLPPRQTRPPTKEKKNQYVDPQYMGMGVQ